MSVTSTATTRRTIQLPIDDGVEPSGPLASSLDVAGRTLANRFCVLPMEGWDGTPEGRPTELVERGVVRPDGHIVVVTAALPMHSRFARGDLELQ